MKRRKNEMFYSPIIYRENIVMMQYSPFIYAETLVSLKKFNN